MHRGIGLLTLRPGQLGGSETLVRGLLSSLGEAEGEDRYTVVSGARGAASLRPLARGPVRVRTLGSWRAGRGPATQGLAIARGRYAGGALRRELGDEALDAVHYPLTVPVPALAAPKVVTVLDLQHEVMPEFFSPLERIFRRVFYGGAIREASVVVTISEYCRATIVERHGVDPARVLVSLQAVDRRVFRRDPDPEDAARLAGLAIPERFVVYPANAWPHKNHDRLVDALAQVGDRELGLVLTGQPYGRWPELRARAERLGLGERVRHLGYVERGVLPALYRRAGGMVFPSLFEGLGIPPLEAIACGCPVAAADRAALPEMLRGRALLFDPERVEAIAAAIDALTGRAQRAPEPEPAFWERFTWAAAARTHREAYRLASRP